MATLTINGRKVTVDDSFRNLSPEQQEATVNEIASSMGNQEMGSLSATEPGILEGLGNRLYDAANAVGLPASRMRRDAQGLDAAVRGAADTASFGFADEIAAGLGAATGVGGNFGQYDQNLEIQRGIDEADAVVNPNARMAGQVGGGVATALLTGPATMSNRFAGSTLGPRVLSGIADGAAFGGLYGFGSGEGLQDRALEGALGAGIGGAAGAAFPLLAAGGQRAYQTVQNARQINPLAESVGVEPGTLRLLGGVMQADDSLGQTGIANMRAAGQEGMLADAGPTARNILDTSIQRGGPGAIMARDRIAERVGRDSSALGQTLDNTLGVPQGVGSAQNTIRDAAQPNVNQAYQRAYESPIDYASDAGRAVEDIFERMPKSMTTRAINQANELMKYDGLQGQILADIAEDGTVTMRNMPNVAQADYVKKALDQIAQDGKDPITGRLNSEGAFANRVARDLRKAVGDAVPAYREALETAADPLSQQSAIRLGSNLSNMTRDEFGIAVDGMTAPEKAAVLQGFRSRIDDQMANVTRAVSDGDMDAREAIRGLRELSSRKTRENIRAVTDAEQANALFDEIDRITKSFELRAGVTDNSRTYARQATDRRVQDMTAPGVIGTAARGQPVNAGQRVIQALTGQTDDVLRGNQDRIYSEIADLLTRQGGAGQDVYGAVAGINQTDQATQLMTNRIAELLATQRLAYPATTLIDNRMP